MPKHGCDLTPERAAAVYARVDWMRRYLERLIDRMDALGFPGSDPLRFAASRALLEMSELVLRANDLRDNGKAHNVLKRARNWPKPNG